MPVPIESTTWSDWATVNIQSPSRALDPIRTVATGASMPRSEQGWRSTGSPRTNPPHSTTVSRGDTQARPPQSSVSSAGSTSRGSGKPSTGLQGGSVATPNSTTQSSGGSLDADAKKAIIVAAVIGTILIFAFITFVLWKRRRSPRNRHNLKASDMAPLRPPSTVTFLSSNTRDANLTALPMYREGRRKSPETGNESSNPPLRERPLFVQTPSNYDLWKALNPPTPTTPQNRPDLGNGFNSSQLRPPEMAQLEKASPMASISSLGVHEFFDAVESISVPSAIDLEAATSLPGRTTKAAPQHRWSWATSFNSARSRLDGRRLNDTISSLPGIQTMRGWMGYPSMVPQPSPGIDGQAGLSRASSVTFLKNKATKPNLAPFPTRELSIGTLRSESKLSAKEAVVVNSQEIEDIDGPIPKDGIVS